METIVDILGLAVKTDTVLTDGLLTKILEESKIDEVKIVVPKTKVEKTGELTMDLLKTKVANVSIIDDANSVDEGGIFSLVDEVEVTSVSDMLS